eukprot:scaffold1484_cov241-Pinguiococcus_pyrenoidosus.AAC.26
MAWALHGVEAAHLQSSADHSLGEALPDVILGGFVVRVVTEVPEQEPGPGLREEPATHEAHVLGGGHGRGDDSRRDIARVP